MRCVTVGAEILAAVAACHWYMEEMQAAAKCQ